jgi:hypothetical protein
MRRRAKETLAREEPLVTAVQQPTFDTDLSSTRVRYGAVIEVSANLEIAQGEAAGASKEGGVLEHASTPLTGRRP